MREDAAESAEGLLVRANGVLERLSAVELRTLFGLKKPPSEIRPPSDGCYFGGHFAKIWRARCRLYQNEILQENMRLTAFFKLYKICILSHRCNLKFSQKIGLKFSNFREISAKKM